MASSDSLIEFVREALSRGQARPAIERALVEAGWSRQQVNDALAHFADSPFPVPVPRPHMATDARESFLYALLVVALCLTAYNVGAFLFAVIEQVVPFRGDREFADATRWPISILVVTVPVHLYVSHLIRADIRRDPGKLLTRTRSQSLYLILFLTAAVVIGVLAGLVYTFLGDDLTGRFVLKSAAAAGVAGALFAYYLRDLRTSPATD